ncbi:hypothetical protein PaeBR_12635 [Paenibacillus sp. BR2-3]|uniref:hypothetical protein n=1 Tax=Paenibacillus sp. BR2-3 TaxID=3048494 RepID=UPI003977A91D
MLIFMMYLFTFTGVSLLLLAASIKLKLLFPLTSHNKLIVAVSTFHLKFPKRMITPNKTHIIAIHDSAKKIAIGTYPSSLPKKASAVLYSFDEIMGSEIVENALTLTKATKTSRLSRIVFNNEITAATDNIEDISELILKIYIKSIETPVYCISFLPGELPLQKSDARYTQAFSDALELHRLVIEILTNDNSSSLNAFT